MVWRRFTEGRIGSLSARQYTEVQDAVRDLVSDLGVRSVDQLAPLRPMLVRIKQRLTTSTQGAGSVPGSNAVNGAVYKFEQLFVRVTDSRIEVAKRDYGIESRDPVSGNENDRAIAIDLTRDSNIPQNTIVTVYPAAIDMGESRNAVAAKQSVFVVMNPPASDSIGLYSIVSSTGEGTYTVREVGQSGSTTETMINLYETNSWYGALDEPQNPCAQLEPRNLGAGSVVFGFRRGSGLYTCAPTSWTVTCTNCGGVAEATLAEAYDQSNAESIAASIMLAD